MTKSAAPQLLLVVLLLFACLFTITNAQVIITETSLCSDATSPTCFITFTTQSTTLNQRGVEVAVPSWIQGVESIQQSSDVGLTLPCEITARGFVLNFLKGVRNVQCFIHKKQGLTPSSTTNTGLVFPQLTYYDVPFELTPNNDDCRNPSSSKLCTASFSFPLTSGAFTVQTTSNIEFTCPESILTVSVPATVEVYPNNLSTAITVFDHLFTPISPPTDTTTGAGTCTLRALKSSPLTPYFYVLQNGKVIYQNTDIILNTLTLTADPTDCNDTTSSVCTITYIVPILQDDQFKVDIPFFNAKWDNFPVLDPSYTNPLQPLERRYTQRFLKSLDPNSNTYLGSTTADVYINGVFITQVLTLSIENIRFTEPLQVYYDTEICANPELSFCRVYYTTKYVGYHLTLNLNTLPFVHRSENVFVCFGNMTIFTTTPTRLEIGHVDLSDSLSTQNLIVQPPPGMSYISCFADYDVRFDHLKNLGAFTPVTNWYISSYSQRYQHVNSGFSRIPLPLLSPTEYDFNVIPFEFELDPLCESQYDDRCGYLFKITPDDQAVTDEEKQDALNKLRFTSFSVPVYDLKQPNLDHQDVSEVVQIFVHNSIILTASLSMRWTRAKLGYDIATITITTNHDQSQDFYELFFQTDPNTGKLMDVIVELSYLLEIPKDYTISRPSRDIWILEYNGLDQIEPYTSLYTTKENEISLVPLFSFTYDEQMCASVDSAFCLISFTSLMDSETNQATEYTKGMTMRSILLQVPTMNIIDIDKTHSSMQYIQSIELVTPRYQTDPDQENKFLLIEESLTFNVTFSDAFKTAGEFNPLQISFVKRLGARYVGRISVPAYTITKDFTDPVDETIITATQWFTLPLKSYYIYPLVNYNGLRFSYGDDCADSSDDKCTFTFHIGTNNIYPGTIIAKIPSLDAFNAFFQIILLGCEGFEGMTTIESLNYIKMDTLQTHTQILATNGNFNDPRFSASNPLHFDSTKRLTVECTGIGWKTVSSKMQYHPAILPSILMDIAHREGEYAIYSVPDGTRVRFQLAPTDYSIFSMDPLDDCRTAHTSMVVCTNKLTVHATPHNPLTHVTTFIPQAAFTTHEVLLASAYYGFLQYGHLCPTPSTPEGMEMLQLKKHYERLFQNSRLGRIVRESVSPLKTTSTTTTTMDPASTVNDFTPYLDLLTTIAELNFVTQDFDPETLLYHAAPGAFSEKGNHSSTLIGYYDYYIPLCDSTQLVIVNFTIQPEYQTVSSTSYFTMTFPTIAFPLLEIPTPHVVTGEVEYHFIPNYYTLYYNHLRLEEMKENGMYDEATATIAERIKNFDSLAIRESSPEISKYPSCALARAIDIALSRPVVVGSTDVVVTISFAEDRLEKVVMMTILGSFGNLALRQQSSTHITPLECISPHTKEVLALLYTNSVEGTTTFITTKQEDHPTQHKFVVGDVCEFIMPVNFLYPTVWRNVLNYVYLLSPNSSAEESGLVDVDDDDTKLDRYYFLTSFTQYTNPANIISVKKSNNQENSSINITHMSHIAIILVIIAVLM